MNSDLVVENGILKIRNRRGEISWDSASFRPDPKFVLKDNEFYQGLVYYEVYNLPNGEITEHPSKIEIQSKTFINIR